MRIVLIGNIARCGRAQLASHLGGDHRIDEYPCDLSEADVLVGSPVTAEMIAAAPRLRLVHASGAGLDAIDVNALPESVALCNVFHHERSIAEHVMMCILALARNLFSQDRNLRAGNWEGSCVAGPPKAAELSGKVAGLLGYGHIGREVARLAAAHHMECLALRSTHSRQEMEAFLSSIDYLVIACPLTERTRGLIGAAEIAWMEPEACVINVARGEVVDETALFEALRDKRIRGAAIDVWYRYPQDGESQLPSRYPFHALENVILTPHSSGWTESVVVARFRDIAANIDRLSAGQPLQNSVAVTY